MIIWIASYPKSGNTWLRTLLSAYYYSKDGIFYNELIKEIGQFPEKRHFKSFKYDPKSVIGTTYFWIKAQEKINQDKKLRFFKTHNVFGKINNNSFTDKQNSLGCIYIIRDPRNVITSLSPLRPAYWPKDLPIKIVRYEDLLEKTFFVTREIIEFVDKISKSNQKLDVQKLRNSVNSTSFKKLQKNEKEKGFSEAIYSKNKKKMIPFFNLGPDNNWKNILDKAFVKKLNEIFKKDLNEFNYFT